MFLELLNTLLLKIFDYFFEDLEELNSDCYPENYITIINKNGKEELIKYEI